MYLPKLKAFIRYFHHYFHHSTGIEWMALMCFGMIFDKPKQKSSDHAKLFARRCRFLLSRTSNL